MFTVKIVHYPKEQEPKLSVQPSAKVEAVSAPQHVWLFECQSVSLRKHSLGAGDIRIPMRELVADIQPNDILVSIPMDMQEYASEILQIGLVGSETPILQTILAWNSQVFVMNDQGVTIDRLYCH